MTDSSPSIERARDAVAAFFTPVDHDLARHDEVQDDIASRRQKVIEQLGQMVEKIDNELPMQAGAAMAKFMPVTTYLSALKDQEASARKRVELKLKNKEVDANNNTAEVVAEFLRRRPDQRLQEIPTSHLADTTTALADEVDQSDRPILESEMRTDPTDLE